VRLPYPKVGNAVSFAALSHQLGFAGLARISAWQRLSPHATHALLNESQWMFQGRSPWKNSILARNGLAIVVLYLSSRCAHPKTTYSKLLMNVINHNKHSEGEGINVKSRDNLSCTVESESLRFLKCFSVVLQAHGLVHIFY
jgi:hypothetical protein